MFVVSGHRHWINSLFLVWHPEFIIKTLDVFEMPVLVGLAFVRERD